MGNGKTFNGNPNVIRNVGKLKPLLTQEVKNLLKDNSNEKIIREAITWLGYERVAKKEYDYIIKKLKLSNE
jgi:hypothetical protein